MMRKILVIDDNTYIQDATTDMLELALFKTVIAEDGLDGMRKALVEAPDLILCDYHMPNMSGLNLLHQIRHCSDTMLIPFVFMTGDTGSEVRQRSRQLGANGFLIKPFNYQELIAAVSEHLCSQTHLK